MELDTSDWRAMSEEVKLDRPGEHRRFLLGVAQIRRSDGRSSDAPPVGADGLVRGDLLLKVLNRVLVIDLLLLEDDDPPPPPLQGVPQRVGLVFDWADVLVCEPRVGLEGLGGALKSVQCEVLINGFVTVKNRNEKWKMKNKWKCEYEKCVYYWWWEIVFLTGQVCS